MTWLITWPMTWPMIGLIVACAIFTLAVCKWANWFGVILGVMDQPDGERKLHSTATPLVGGMAVVLPVLASAVYLAETTILSAFYYTFAVATLAVMLLGLIDDRRHIRPLIRLVVSLGIGLGIIVAVPEINVTFLSFSFLGHAIFLNGGWAVIFSLLCLVGLQNAINMADGQNGLVMGMTLIWVVCLSAYAPAHLLPLLIVFATGLAIGLMFNLNGRLFLGDSGSYAISISIGILTIYVYKVAFDRLPADVVVLWFLVPVVDCLRLMVTRIIRGRSPFSSDRHHLHHILQDMVAPKQALYCYLGLLAGPAVLAWLWPSHTLWWGMVVVSVYVAVLIFRKRGFAQLNASPS